ncbi:hypothetical protein GQ53DRAFT_664268 [Thozetella sp. PMI_491]|nr:hypothetical protein GQ53DRAFT_664268 [Thozetella sp. PMI_491]
MAQQSLDAESLRIAVELQLGDLADLVDKKGKGREGDESDLQVALQIYKSELEEYQQILSDRSICRSIAQTVSRDGDLVSAAERLAIHGRLITTELSQGREVMNATNSQETNSTSEDESLGQLAALNVLPALEAGESSTLAGSYWSQHSEKRDAIQKKTCLICTEEHLVENVSQCPCSHEYCRECLQNLFRASFTDQSLFPPRCCSQLIPIEPNRSLLSPQIIGEFKAKELEFNTKDPTYCSQPTCSTFVPPQLVKGDVAVCPNCSTKTCTICKTQSHSGDCPKDTATQELLRVAEENGWQRCSHCRRVVELSRGCYHITCLCGAHFCYLYGAKWKTCKCVQWHEQLLLDRANAVADRALAGQQAGQQVRAAVVQQARDNINQNHECHHRHWKKIYGGHQCDVCQLRMSEYVFECTRCKISACRRCRFNRL